MSAKTTPPDRGAEIAAVGTIYEALKAFDPKVQARLIRWAAEMLELDLDFIPESSAAVRDNQSKTQPDDYKVATQVVSATDDALDGVNAIAIKWIKRNNFDAAKLQTIFSLGIEDIDLVAKKIPGTGKKERMHNVLLLQAVAAYLSSGVAKVSYEQLKEAWQHYKVYDPTNSATYLKSWASEVSGTRESGFALTSRGLNEATDLVATMLSNA